MDDGGRVGRGGDGTETPHGELRAAAGDASGGSLCVLAWARDKTHGNH